MTPYSLLLRDNLYTLKLEAGRGGCVLKNVYIETQQWLQTQSWIRKVWKFMSKNHVNISNLGTEVSTQLTHDYCLMSHLALEGEFTVSELRAINRCRMSKGIFFISNIRNHQGTQLQKSATDNVTSLNLIQDFNWPRKHHTNILE